LKSNNTGSIEIVLLVELAKAPGRIYNSLFTVVSVILYRYCINFVKISDNWAIRLWCAVS
jgi:hypothetical protein